MKKFYYLCLMVGLTLGSLTFTACGDDDDDNGKNNSETVDNEQKTDDSAVTVDDLIGTWKINSTDNSYVAIFTKDQVTIKENGEVRLQSNYTFKDGVITIPGQNNHEYQSVPGLLYGKSVMILKSVYKYEEGSEEMLAYVLFKEGKTVSATSQDIQGFWCWYEDYGEEGVFIRAAMKFNGSNFELIITPWGQRYVGTFTYQNGIIHLNATNGYTSRDEHTGNGDLWGGMDPETLEYDDWKTLDRENWTIDAVSDTPFIVSGDKAYGFLANIPCILDRKK